MTADEFRARHPHEGFVVFSPEGEACGWTLNLGDPAEHRPGCVAVSPEGFRWVARGGNDERGADRWEPDLTVVA